MKKLIMTIVIAACLALCAAVWPQTEVVGKTPAPAPTHAVNTAEPRAGACTCGSARSSRTCTDAGARTHPHLETSSRPDANGHRPAARRRGVCEGLWLTGIPGAQ